MDYHPNRLYFAIFLVVTHSYNFSIYHDEIVKSCIERMDHSVYTVNIQQCPSLWLFSIIVSFQAVIVVNVCLLKLKLDQAKIASLIFICLGFKCKTTSSVPYFPGRCNLVEHLMDSFRTCHSQERWVHLLQGTTNCVLFLSTLIRGLQSNFSRFRFRKTALSPVSKGGCSSLLGYIVASLKYTSSKIQFLPALDTQTSGAKILPGSINQGVWNGGTHQLFLCVPFAIFSSINYLKISHSFASWL